MNTYLKLWAWTEICGQFWWWLIGLQIKNSIWFWFLHELEILDNFGGDWFDWLQITNSSFDLILVSDLDCTTKFEFFLSVWNMHVISNSFCLEPDHHFILAHHMLNIFFHFLNTAVFQLWFGPWDHLHFSLHLDYTFHSNSIR